MNFDDNSLYNIKSSVDGKRYSLFELATWKNGLAFKKINFCETGVPVIKIAELNNGIGGTTAYTQQTFSEDVHLCKGDLLFSWSGNPQTSIDIFRFNLDEGWLNQHIFKVTPDEKTVDRDYFYFLMKNLKPHFTQIATNKQTTGLGHVTIADIKRMSVVIPSLDVQREIVSYIKPIDDKIELNNEINSNLEQQASALYSEYFSSKSTQDCATATLDEFCEIFTGRKNSNASVPNGKYKFFTCSPEPLLIDSHIYDGNAIIVSGNGAYTGRTRFYSGKFDLYQRTYACTLKQHLNDDYIFPLYWFVKLELSKKIMGGTRGSAIPYIVMNDLAKFEFGFDKAKFEQYMTTFKTITETIQANENENERLASVRDTLLPKLMSGELDVSEVEI